MTGRRGVKIPYSRVKKNGRRYWEPTPEMQKAGFQPKPLGIEGPDSRREALRLFQAWEAHRTGKPEPVAAPPTKGREMAEIMRVWPRGSIGEAYVRFMRTPEWGKLAHSTRNRDILPSWAYIRDPWGSTDPNLMTLDILSEWREELREKHGDGIAHKVFKEWRRHWRVMVALRTAVGSDPSLGIRNAAPPPRWQTWSEGEVVRLVKKAIRRSDLRLAVMIAAIWDTQFQPGDVRTLKAKHLRAVGAMGEEFLFDRTVDGRQKTGKPAIGTLSRRTRRLLDAYLAKMPAMMPEAWLFPLSTKRVMAISELTRAFRELCESIFPGDARQLRDMRRSGTVEAFAGGASPSDVGTKMANSIGRSNTLHSTYNPVNLASVRRADSARLIGRRARRDGT
jgi:hypothetical protein